tara:strand:- start:524 stop:709 length:186 start_codon:yes stop_codon:yes gene_type:complete
LFGGENNAVKKVTVKIIHIITINIKFIFEFLETTFKDGKVLYFEFLESTFIKGKLLYKIIK